MSSSPSSPLPVNLEEVLRREREFIAHQRHPDRDPDRVARTLVGLAMSGGGIRSATTNLGILQALSRMDMLPLVDYVSTVSGGGYIGGCLSSLLSWNGQRAIGRTAAEAPYTFRANDRPRFTTNWERFPFRTEELPGHSRAGRDIVAHLRTHGNFLIARLGLLTRDTLRGVSQILTGLVCNVLMFLLTLLAAASFYLSAVHFLAPDMSETLGVTPPPVVAADTSPSTLLAGDSTTVRIRTEPCLPGAPGCQVETRTTLQPPSLMARLARNARVLAAVFGGNVRALRGEPVIVASTPMWRGVPTPFIVLAIAFGLGLAFSLAVFGWMRFAEARYLLDGETTGAVPGRGESADDAFERRILRQLAAAAGAVAAALLLWLWLWRRAWLHGPEQLVLLFTPFAFFTGGRVMAFVLSTMVLFRTKVWTRRARSRWGAYCGITIYGWPVMLLAGAAPLAIYALRDNTTGLGVSAAASLIVSRLLTTREGKDGSARLSMPPRVRNALLAVVVTLVILLAGAYFAATVLRFAPHAPGQLATGVVVTLVLLPFAFLVDENRTGPQYFYRDRLAETYLMSLRPDTDGLLWTYRDAIEMPLTCLHGRPDPSNPTFRNTAPYHLISSAINLGGSRDLTRKDRKSGYWVFSRLFCGSVHTGFRPTSEYRAGETKLARALAISGAAVGAAMGSFTFLAQAFATVLFNLRLGYWIENPAHPASLRERNRVFWPLYLWREVTMNTTETQPLVNLSDGGHTGDNVGIYPLLQRRCKVIVACDCEKDDAIAFGSFTEALRQAYVDMGVEVDIDLGMIRRQPETGFSRAHCAVGRIHYPDRPDQESFLVYMKTSLTGDEPEPVLNYKATAPAFPHESTGDQFFTDAQFESYRALGVHIAEDTFRSWVATSWFDAARRNHAPVPMP